MVEKDNKWKRFYVIVTLIGVLCILLFVRIANHSLLKKESVVLLNSPSKISANMIVDRCIFELTGIPLEEISSWVAQNMDLKETRLKVQISNGSKRKMKEDEKFQMPILNDLEDLEFQKFAYRYRFEIIFLELPEFMKKGLENVSENDIGKSVNEIFSWLPQKPAFLRTVNKKTGEIADTRYLDCFLTSLSENKREIVIETENFGFSDNPLIAGRIKERNLLFFPPKWTSTKEGKWVLKGTFFERRKERYNEK